MLHWRHSGCSRHTLKFELWDFWNKHWDTKPLIHILAHFKLKLVVQPDNIWCIIKNEMVGYNLLLNHHHQLELLLATPNRPRTEWVCRHSWTTHEKPLQKVSLKEGLSPLVEYAVWHYTCCTYPPGREKNIKLKLCQAGIFQRPIHCLQNEYLRCSKVAKAWFAYKHNSEWPIPSSRAWV